MKISDLGDHDRLPFAVRQFFPGGRMSDFGIAKSAAIGPSAAAINGWLETRRSIQ